MALASIPAVLEDQSVFTRESGNGLHGVVSYMISNFLVSLPFIYILSLGFSLDKTLAKNYPSPLKSRIRYNISMYHKIS
jgi:hypothetical protein